MNKLSENESERKQHAKELSKKEKEYEKMEAELNKAMERNAEFERSSIKLTEDIKFGKVHGLIVVCF